MLVETTFHITAPNRLADVARWTEILGITPGASARKGERLGRSPSPDSWWGLILEKRQVESAEEPLRELLELLIPHTAAIAELAVAESLEIAMASYVWEPTQGLAVDLSPAVLGSLAHLGCSYSVVVYD